MMTSSDMSSTGDGEHCEERCEVDQVQTERVREARQRIPGNLEWAVETAGLLSNPTRLRILAALCPRSGEADPRLCVCDLSAVVGATETATSHQLRSLRLSGRVDQQREGRLVYYRLATDPTLRAVVSALIAKAGD